MVAPFPSPAVIAHRGASAYAPEHSFAAYDLALELGADVLELDVRPLADGRLAVVHDATLARTCGDPRPVDRLSVSDLEELDPATRPETLDAVLARYRGRTRYLLDLKAPRPEDLRILLEAVEAGGVRDAVAVQCFDHAAMRALRALDGDLPISALYPRVPGRLVQAGLAQVATWAGAVAPCASSVGARLVTRAHARGLLVHAYTVNTEPELRRLHALGVDGLITDVPDRARAALAAPLPLAA